jgi:hypothetical protein
LRAIDLKDLMRQRTVRLLLIAVGLVCGLPMAGCTAQTESPAFTQSIPPSPSAGVIFWQEQFPGLNLVCWAENDLNADNRPDTVIIYRLDNNKCRLSIVINLAGGFRLTSPIAAPVSDQQISFTDFDSKPPMEVVVTGKNGSFVGTAIFRLEKEQMVNLFDEDFDKCCGAGQSRTQAPLLI